MKQAIIRRHYSDVLMKLCESEQLADIKVADLVKASGLSRQTFYNHFSKLDDLTCFSAARATIESPYSPFDPRGMVFAGKYAIAHPGFFSQVPSHTECGYRERFFKWISKQAHIVFMQKELSREENTRRAIQIRLFCNGAYDVFSAWSTIGFKIVPDVIAQATADMMPSFMLTSEHVNYASSDPAFVL